MEITDQIARMSNEEYDSVTFKHLGTKTVDLAEFLGPQICIERETFILPLRKNQEEEIEKRYGQKIRETRARVNDPFIMIVHRDSFLEPEKLSSRAEILGAIKKSAPVGANRFDFVCACGSEVTLDDSYCARVHYYKTI